jgi:hypothetical protein
MAHPRNPNSGNAGQTSGPGPPTQPHQDQRRAKPRSAEPVHGSRFSAVDVVVFDPRRNRRNDPVYRPAFHAQGSYFRAYEDAGFVADPAELRDVWRAAEAAGLEPVARSTFTADSQLTSPASTFGSTIRPSPGT